MGDWFAAARSDEALHEDFAALCGFGGRLAGTAPNSAAVDWSVGRLASALGPSGRAYRKDIGFAGWRVEAAELQSESCPDSRWRCMPLLRSANTPPDGLCAEVVDLGVGREADFQARAGEIPGRIVLVEHEYPFSPTHIHRRRKYDWAMRAGAVGFLIANPWDGGGLMSGSSGRSPGGAGIPAAYVDSATREALRAMVRSGQPAVRLLIQGEDAPDAQAGIAIAERPGGRPEWIVISAHIDGHALAESALDNASGVAVAIAAARALASRVGADTPGLRICLFNAEEWALAGSAHYLDAMSAEERAAIRLNINLDTVGGDRQLTALTSGFPALEPFLGNCADRTGIELKFWRPLMSNSDHANFARWGIPAFRLVAGFDRPDSRVRAILSTEDRRDRVHPEELVQALALTCTIAERSLTMPSEALAALARPNDALDGR